MAVKFIVLIVSLHNRMAEEEDGKMSVRDKCDRVIIHVTSLSGIFLTMMFFRNAKFGGRLFQTKSLSINLVAVSNKILTK